MRHKPGCMKLLAWDEPNSCTCDASVESPSPDVDFETALTEKIQAATDATFKCGEWNSDDLDSYDVLLEASERADDALIEFVTTALIRARADLELLRQADQDCLQDNRRQIRGLQAQLTRAREEERKVLRTLHAQIAMMPFRRERMSGQTLSYVRREEVLGCIENLMTPTRDTDR
jgi:hypothetical protein